MNKNLGQKAVALIENPGPDNSAARIVRQMDIGALPNGTILVTAKDAYDFANNCLKDCLETASCSWKEDDEGNWNTGCGEMFVLSCDTPKEHNMNFCCFCGKSLKVAMGRTKYAR